MFKRYVYKNANKRTVNISGYQFSEGQELESEVLINGFNEAVSNGFLTLVERKPETPEPDATQALQTGSAGKVKVIFHMGNVIEGEEILKELELDIHAPVEFPAVELLPRPEFEGWFKNAEFTKPVNPDNAKAPKKGEIHFYAKFATSKTEDTLPANSNPSDPQNPGEGEGSLHEQGDSSAGNESSSVGGEAAGEGSESK